MHALNLPAYPFQIQSIDGREMIFDAIRQKYVRLTPEEWVRQHFVQFLVQEQGVPQALIAIEKAFLFQNMTRRADIVVHNRQGRPLLMVECKAPEVAIKQTAFDEVSRYYKVVGAAYLVVTNGLVHYCAALDADAHSYRFLDSLPTYEAL
jgi:hypothetical protein